MRLELNFVLRACLSFHRELVNITVLRRQKALQIVSMDEDVCQQCVKQYSGR